MDGKVERNPASVPHSSGGRHRSDDGHTERSSGVLLVEEAYGRPWRDPLLWLTLALTIFAVAPFLQPGYHWGANDARHHVYFLFEFDRAISDGVWWPRWSPDFTFGYGYPFFNIYGPLSYFVGEFFLRVVGMSHVGAVETVFCLSIVGSAATMYLFMRSWAGRHAALISALVYVYAPYHLLNLYVRANLAESVAFVWMPLCLWMLRATIVRPSFWNTLGLGLSLAALLLTSQLVTLLFAPLLLLYGLALFWIHAVPDGTLDLMLPLWVRVGRGLRGVVAPVLGGLIAVGVSCIFWLPMVMEYGDVSVDQWFDGRYDFRGDFVYLFQLLSPHWGFGASQPGPDDPIGFQIGVIALLLAVVGTLQTWRAGAVQRWAVASFVLAGVGATLVGTQIGAPLWDWPVIGGILGTAQFPWRWFNLTTVCVSVLAGLAAYSQRQQPGDEARTPAPDQPLTMGLLALATVVILGSYPLLRVEIIEPAEGPVSLPGLMQFQRTADEMTGVTRWVNFVPTWSPIATGYLLQAQEMPPEEVPPITTKLDNTDEQMEYTEGTGYYAHSLAHNSVMEKVWYFSGVDDWRIVFNQFYYPGWKAYLLDGEDGPPVRELAIVPGEAIPQEGIPSGRITVPVPRGEGYVLLRFEDTPPRRVGKLVSLGTLALLLVFGTYYALKGIAPLRDNR